MNWISFASGGAPGVPPDLTMILFMLLMFGGLYFVMIRPQRKKQQELQKMVAALKKGDRVVTNGGIFGTVAGVKDNILVVRIADDVKIEVLKSAIASVVNNKEGGA